VSARDNGSGRAERKGPLATLFQPAVRAWFSDAFAGPTRAQRLGWPAIARGDSTLILAPTGSGKTLAAFLFCLDRLMFAPPPEEARRCRVLYVSPLKALAVDVERNLRRPLAGIAAEATLRGEPFHLPSVAIRTGDTPQTERARFRRHPADILITTPESLYLLLTSQARDALKWVETVIIDEIHALVPTKRGAHLSLSLERLAAVCERPFQRIGLSATIRPLEEAARFLGGVETEKAQNPRRRSTTGRTSTRSLATDRPEGADAIVRNTVEQQFSVVRPERYRPVTVVDAGAKKPLSLRVEVPVEAMARPAVLSGAQQREADPDGDREISAGAGDWPSKPGHAAPRSADAREQTRPSIWTAIHPRLLQLVRAHRTTLIFVNSRRLAERLSGALNALAGETLVRSHHGSIAPAQRAEVEDLLKSGALRALVATSSLELGIDMGAVDLVVQIEAPPSVASGLQRIGRGGHQLDAVSEGVVFPKFRGDLLACAAVTRAMHEGAVESARFPRNPLDVLAQQIVATVSMDAWGVDELFEMIRRAAPFAGLSRGAFEGVLDMLSGRYPSDEFAELRPRITWDRRRGRVAAREGAKRIAIVNGGTIPDRGLYGVFLASDDRRMGRVGELDEEMVFESRPGETFVLGASTWRIEVITHDRVLVSPAPGQPGKMPFWKGDAAGRPLELGLAIGRLTRDLLRMPPVAALHRLRIEHDLDPLAAENLLQYLRDQQAATRALPDAETILIERVRDELGDWRVCVLSPRGGPVHAPWAMAVAAAIRDKTGVDVETLWGDDGFVVRYPDVEEAPDEHLFIPSDDKVQRLVARQLGATALFAAKFRENAARSLLLPRRRPGMRAPLWQQRKRAADLLAVAARYGSFPVILETYRECLHDFFDIPALVETLAEVRSGKIQIVTVDRTAPSPFAASLLFNYVASFLYDGDAPLAERRAQALAVDQTQLAELLGDAELRELLDRDALTSTERQLQHLDPAYQARSADTVHDLLLSVGDLTIQELRDRTTPEGADTIEDLLASGRILSVSIADQARHVASEDASRYRDALAVSLPSGIPEDLLQPTADPMGDLALRYARTHAPFPASDFAARYALPVPVAQGVLKRLSGEGRLLEGEFRPGGASREWTHPDVLRQIRRRSLASLRHQAEPVDESVVGRFTTIWQGIVRRRSGTDALLDAVHQLQGAPLAASILETEILPARIHAYNPADLDALAAAGEVVWVGVEPIGDRDGRVALYLADEVARLLPPELANGPRPVLDGSDGVAHGSREAAILECLRRRGASFFATLHAEAGGGYEPETVDALWRLVWRGLVTNDTFHALRAFTQPPLRRRSHEARHSDLSTYRSRRTAPPSAQGRWSLLARTASEPGSGRSRSALVTSSAHTQWALAIAQQLLARHGIVTREVAAAESLPGGFAVLYPVLSAMEARGRVRRGYFVAGLGGAQFAAPDALEMLRGLRDLTPRHDADERTVALAATDPANPYGAMLKWSSGATADRSAQQGTSVFRRQAPGLPEARSPESEANVSTADATSTNAQGGRGPTRSVGSTVILVNGSLAGYVARGNREVMVYLPEAEPERSMFAREIARVLMERAREDVDGSRGMLIEQIDGAPAVTHPIAPYLVEAGFAPGPMGMQARVRER
jgi:ATP-dependent helicase Lhr and Lhr-like helicase